MHWTIVKLANSWGARRMIADFSAAGQGRTSTCGSSWRSCCRRRRCTARPSAGWTVRAASSRSRTASASPNCGASARTGRPWTTTSWAAASANTTARASWRRRSVRSGSSTSSATRTPSKRKKSALCSFFLFTPQSAHFFSVKKTRRVVAVVLVVVVLRLQILSPSPVSWTARLEVTKRCPFFHVSNAVVKWEMYLPMAAVLFYVPLTFCKSTNQFCVCVHVVSSFMMRVSCSSCLGCLEGNFHTEVVFFSSDRFLTNTDKSKPTNQLCSCVSVCVCPLLSGRPSIHSPFDFSLARALVFCFVSGVLFAARHLSSVARARSVVPTNSNTGATKENGGWRVPKDDSLCPIYLWYIALGTFHEQPHFSHVCLFCLRFFVSMCADPTISKS